MTKYSALHSFLEQFLPAYEENTVPDDANLPYITYSVTTDEFNYPVPIQFSVWYKDMGWREINSKVEEISHLITRGGVFIPFEDGAMWITKGTPFAQNVPDDSDLIRRKLINLMVEFID